MAKNLETVSVKTGICQRAGRRHNLIMYKDDSFGLFLAAGRSKDLVS